MPNVVDPFRWQEPSYMRAGRFTLVKGTDTYVTSWDTWEEAQAAFPLPEYYFLYDNETGRRWDPGYGQGWEDART